MKIWKAVKEDLETDEHSLYATMFYKESEVVKSDDGVKVSLSFNKKPGYDVCLVREFQKDGDKDADVYNQIYSFAQEALKEGQVFITPGQSGEGLKKVQKNLIESIKENKPLRIDLPFDSVWLEFSQGNTYGMEGKKLESIFLHSDDDENYKYLISTPCGLPAFGLDKKEGKRTRLIYGEFTIDEVTDFFDRTEVDGEKAIRISENPAAIVWFYMYNFTTLITGKHSHAEVDESLPVKVIGKKSGRPKTKKFIKTVTYLAENTKRAYKLYGKRKEMVFTHQYRIRGHWRDIDPESFGKNRKGEYIIPGETWVIPGIGNRSKPELPLIEKTRVIRKKKD